MRRATWLELFLYYQDNNFYPRSPCGERLKCAICRIKVCIFLSTLSLRRATRAPNPHPCLRSISIHALLAESDADTSEHFKVIKIFLSTLSLRRATTDGSICLDSRLLFLSTLSLRRATKVRVVEPGLLNISIHALLAESDVGVAESADTGDISIHALLAESDPRPPAPPRREFFFYSRSPCGERRYHFTTRMRIIKISIHALLAESDRVNLLRFERVKLFLSTLSLRRATLAGPSGPAFLFNFYPRSPCGERPFGLPATSLAHREFLSTLSLRRATENTSRRS